MIAKFKLIQNNFSNQSKSKFSKYGLILITLIGVLLILIINFKIPIYLQIILILLAGLGIEIIKRKDVNWISKEEKFIGELILTSEKIEIQPSNEEINLGGIEKINLLFKYTKGHPISSKDVIYNGFAELKIIQKDKEEKNLKFVFDNRKEFEGLKMIIKSWYKKGIEIEEQFINQETICLELKSSFSFQELQILKENLKKK